MTTHEMKAFERAVDSNRKYLATAVEATRTFQGNAADIQMLVARIFERGFSAGWDAGLNFPEVEQEPKP